MAELLQSQSEIANAPQCSQGPVPAVDRAALSLWVLLVAGLSFEPVREEFGKRATMTALNADGFIPDIPRRLLAGARLGIPP